MAGIVGSAVAGEAVRRLSLFLSGEEDGDRETTAIKVERVEMAVLKLETVVAMSEDWQITHAPLLRWKAKLKRVLREGKGIVRAHRRNTASSTSLERMRSKSLPRRMARLAKRFMPFAGGSNPDDDDDDDGLTDSTVRRFERIADGADEFLKFVRCGGGGGRPRNLMFRPSFTWSLAAGETTELSLRMAGGTAVMVLQPWWLELEGGVDGTKAAACLSMCYEDDVAWERNFKLMAVLRTSGSVDVTSLATNCLELLPPQFSSARVAMEELVAEMASRGTNSPAASSMHVPFVRALPHSHSYGFEPATRRRDQFTGGGGARLPREILMVCALSYIRNSSCGLPLELFWHRSPLYLPKKLSEQHEQVEELPEMADGSEAAGAIEQGRQWWCPRSSTRLSLLPVSSPPIYVLQWFKKKVLNSRSHRAA